MPCWKRSGPGDTHHADIRGLPPRAGTQTCTHTRVHTNTPTWIHMPTPNHTHVHTPTHPPNGTHVHTLHICTRTHTDTTHVHMHTQSTRRGAHTDTPNHTHVCMNTALMHMCAHPHSHGQHTHTRCAFYLGKRPSFFRPKTDLMAKESAPLECSGNLQTPRLALRGEESRVRAMLFKERAVGL